MDALDALVHDLSQLGVRQGGVLLVHAALRPFAHVAGGAEQLIQALLAQLGVHGTLLMPALSYESVGAWQTVFDVRQTPSCVGQLSEFFRLRQGTLRSLHPTHSVCGLGEQAEAILHDHHLDVSPCGAHSAFAKLPHYQGQILFLGCGLHPNTSMHAIEEWSEPPYLFADWVDFQLLDAQGVPHTARIRCHDFQGWEQRYERLADVLSEPALRQGNLAGVACHLVESQPMWQAVHATLQTHPLYFVERISGAEQSL